MQAKTPSLRQIAEELEISPAYLSYMVNGKRPWRRDLYQQYMGVVNTFVNSEAESVNKTPVDRENLASRGGDPPRGRTENLRIKSPLLCRLS